MRDVLKRHAICDRTCNALMRFCGRLVWSRAGALVIGLAAITGFAAPPFFSGHLTGNQIIESAALGYKLQYRVYLPSNHDELAELPVLYVTDGQWYIDRGELPELIDKMITDGTIAPLIAVFVDNRDPGNLSNNRRNSQFFCNRQYIRFYTDELVPAIDATYPTAAEPARRAILGLSFGALNSACFGLYAHGDFRRIAMQSPAMHPVPYIHKAYADSSRLPLKIFLSSGDREDNEQQSRLLRQIFVDKGYDHTYVEVPYGHNWRNWKPLLDDVLVYFFGT